MTKEFLHPIHVDKLTHEIDDKIKTDVIPKEEEYLKLKAKANQYVDDLFQQNLDDMTLRNTAKARIEELGMGVQKQAAQQSELLRSPISTLARRSEDGGEVANALIDLKITVESLDPGSIDFESGWFTRLLGLLPGIGTPLKRYFTKFESAQTVINSIIRSLEMGRDQLTRDNITLKDDQEQFWKTSKEIEECLEFSQLLDHRLEALVSSQESSTEVTHFIQEDLLFVLKQRIMDLQQQLAVQKQAIIATELIIRNNKELIRGINRSLSVTITALNTATTIALALAHQKHVIEKVESVNQTTSKLIRDSAERLKTQGAAIHKQAASTQLDIESLRSAFSDLKIALTDMSEFRIKALPQMSSTIRELDSMIIQANVTVKELENRSQKSLDLPNSSNGKLVTD